jgi:hypothetical protein
MIMIILCVIVVPSNGQCDLLRPTDLNQLARMSFAKKLKKLKKENAILLTSRGSQEKCQYRTYTRCKNYINDSEWHWAEIISLNSCDKILSYSTFDQSHFNELKSDLTKRHQSIGVRTYENLDFQVFQNRRDQVIELNQHPNEQGMMFYLINFIR